MKNTVQQTPTMNPFETQARYPQAALFFEVAMRSDWLPVVAAEDFINHVEELSDFERDELAREARDILASYGHQAQWTRVVALLSGRQRLICSRETANSMRASFDSYVDVMSDLS